MSESSTTRSREDLVAFKRLIRSYIDAVALSKKLKIERQRITCDIKQQDMVVASMQEQVLQAMDDLHIEEDEINIGGNTIIQRVEKRKTRGITMKDVEEEFIRQNGNAMTFIQILNDLRTQRKSTAEVRPMLKLKTK